MAEPEDSGSEVDLDYDSVDYDSHPSLPLALKEVRRRYEDEEDRRSTVETKTGILISIDAIIISVVALFNGIGSRFTTTVIGLAIGSAIIGLYILWPRNYERPGPNIGDIFGESQRDKHDFEKQFNNDYRAAVTTNMIKTIEGIWRSKFVLG